MAEPTIQQLLSAGEPQAAIEQLKTQIQNDGTNPSLWNLLAQAQSLNGNLQGAKQVFVFQHFSLSSVSLSQMSSFGLLA